MVAGVLLFVLGVGAGSGGPRRPTPRFEPPAADLVRPGARQHIEPDSWLGEDKLKHLLVSFAATTFAGAGARSVGLGHGGTLIAGAAFGAAVGIWKELHDRATGGDVSARDLTADALGVAGATVLGAQMR